ncbi:MAG: hypothetical protein JWQ38_1182 [Flavipsychrobacter sp.]|nr:hypothetical protein [Flavipsychrobacter sp.]
MKKLLIVAGVLLLFGSCYNDKYDKLYPAPVVVTCDTSTITFSHDIMPILTTYCNVAGGCHDEAGSNVSGFNFTEYRFFVHQATTDILINDINGTPSTGHNAMPKNLPKMPQCDIDKMTRWVNQGSQDN